LKKTQIYLKYSSALFLILETESVYR